MNDLSLNKIYNPNTIKEWEKILRASIYASKLLHELYVIDEPFVYTNKNLNPYLKTFKKILNGDIVLRENKKIQIKDYNKQTFTGKTLICVALKNALDKESGIITESEVFKNINFSVQDILDCKYISYKSLFAGIMELYDKSFKEFLKVIEQISQKQAYELLDYELGAQICELAENEDFERIKLINNINSLIVERRIDQTLDWLENIITNEVYIKRMPTFSKQLSLNNDNEDKDYIINTEDYFIKIQIKTCNTFYNFMNNEQRQKMISIYNDHNIPIENIEMGKYQIKEDQLKKNTKISLSK